MTHEYSNMLFTTANRRSLCWVRRWQSTISTQEKRVAEMDMW